MKKLAPAKHVIVGKYTWNFRNLTEYLCIGSIITWMTKENFVIWGAGVVYPDQPLKYKPKKVLAVRGPLTRRYLIRQGVECPEIYGDPALLFPHFIIPPRNKKYKLGIIPHFRDKENPLLNKYKQRNDIRIIDVESKKWNSFIEQICECEIVISSSLHGLIISDAYAIPNYWIEFEGGEKRDLLFMIICYL